MLTVVFVVFNIPWVIVGVRMFSGSLWGISRVPYIAPWIAWQLLGWIFCALVAVYIVAKAVGRLGGLAVSKLRASPTAQPLNRPTDLSRRQFLIQVEVAGLPRRVLAAVAQHQRVAMPVQTLLDQAGELQAGSGGANAILPLSRRTKLA